MPGPADAQIAVEALAKSMEALDTSLASRLIQEYGAIHEQLQKDLSRLLVKMKQPGGLKPSQAMRLSQLRTLERQFASRVERFARVAGEAITEAKRAAVGLSVEGSRQVASAGLPRGVTMETLARLEIGWARLPEEAFQAFIGISGEGQPVGMLLAPLGEQAAEGVKASIRSGIATGRGPREIARNVRKVSGMPLSKALTISRTEVNRSYRESTRLNYSANSHLVKGYRRLATKDSRTCLACIALDGTLYENNEPLDAHPNCRCAMVPETLTYKDLGLDVPEDERPPNASSWFDEQDEATQRKMMGGKAYEAYKDGRITLKDMVTTSTSSVWGKSSTVKSVKALGL